MPPRKEKRTAWKRGSGSVRRRASGHYYIRYWAWDPEQRRRRRVEETLDAKTASEARTILNERLGDVSKGVSPVAVSKVRLKDLYADMVADYRNKNQRLVNLERPWKHLEAFFGPECLAKTINDSRMQRFIDKRREEGAAPATILNEISALRRMLRLGHEHRKVAQLPRFPTIRAENARQTYFTREELERLVKALPEEIAEGGRGDLGNEWLTAFVITAFWTGARLRELLHLERRRLDLEAGKITLPPGSTKNRKGRTFYLPPPALAALREWDAKTRALEKERGIIVRMVFHRYGKQISNEFPYGIFHGTCVRAGIVGRRKIHDFRRSAARNYRASGVSEGVVMAICGWRTRAIFDRYDIKNEDDLRKAAAQVVISDEVVARSGGEAEISLISKK